MANLSTNQIHVDRILYNQELLNRSASYEKPKLNICDNVAKKCKSCEPAQCLSRTVPVVGIMAKYKWKEYTIPDIIAGLTIAVMHLPQGMAYAILANVPPVVGLYMGFFPVLVYFLFGTSRHISMGTFAVICLMTGNVVDSFSNSEIFKADNNSTSTVLEVVAERNSYDPIQVTTAVTLMTGVIHILMYTFQLGIVSALLSETLVNGFISGAAVHVVTSQIKDLLGITIPRSKGFFNIIYTYEHIFSELSNFNKMALAISVATIVILVISNELLEPWINKRSIVPLPIQLIVVIIGTIASTYGNLHEIYKIKTVGEIPTGFPVPQVPPASLLGAVTVDSLSIAIVSYSISLSLALTFAQKIGYAIDPNQELLAMGLGNIVGSFFSCAPFAASLSRSVLQKTAGGKTQLASVFSCGVLAIVLLWVGPFFEQLPKCILASIILVALKSTLMQAAECIRFWKLSRYDGLLWIITFLSCVLLDVAIGLLIGVLFSLFIIFVQGIKPYTCLLGAVPNTDLYLDISRYKGTTEIPGIKIFHYCGGLNFASKFYFKSALYDQIELDPQKEFVQREKVKKSIQDNIKGGDNNNRLENKINIMMQSKISCVIIDFSALTYIDPSSVGTLLNICEEFNKIEISVIIAGCSGPVYEKIIKYITLNKIEGVLLKMYPTVHDAVVYAKSFIKLSQFNDISIIRR